MLKKALTNRSINLLNLHFGLFSFAENLVNIFFAIYLYKLGIKLPIIFLALGVTNFLRIFLRPLVMKMFFKIGIRKTLIFGLLTFLPIYPLLGKIQGMDMWLWLYVMMAAIPYTFYWTAYHPYFSMLGDIEHRGKQIGAREIALQGGLALAPLCGGILVSMFGFGANIWGAIFIILISAIPLFCTPDIPLPPKLTYREAFQRVGKEGFWLFFSDCFYESVHDIVWRLVLFLLLGNYFSYGGLLSIAILLQITGSVFSGFSFDQGKGKKLFLVGITLIVLVIIGRSFFAFSIPTVLFFDFLFMIGYTLYAPIKNAVVYNLSKKSHCPLWFHFFAEVGADIGGVIGLIFAATMTSFGVGLRTVLLASILTTLFSARILSQIFSQRKERA